MSDGIFLLCYKNSELIMWTRVTQSNFKEFCNGWWPTFCVLTSPSFLLYFFPVFCFISSSFQWRLVPEVAAWGTRSASKNRSMSRAHPELRGSAGAAADHFVKSLPERMGKSMNVPTSTQCPFHPQKDCKEAGDTCRERAVFGLNKEKVFSP